MDSTEIVRLEDIWVHYDSTPVLEDVDLLISQNDFLGIIGPNGGGKTTLLKLLLGLVKPTRGRVTILGCPPETARRHIGYVSQYSLFDKDFPIKVSDVVLMGRLSCAGLFRRYSKQDKEAATNALRTVGMLQHSDKQIGKLSGGEQQRVLIARALTSEPKLLLLDEPTASIDAPTQREVYELLGELKQRMAVVLVSHDIGAVSAHVDKIACLNRRLFYHGSKELSPSDLEAAYQCPVEMIAHGVPHRILRQHANGGLCQH